MARISDLPDLPLPITNEDVFPINRGPATKKATVAQLFAFLNAVGEAAAALAGRYANADTDENIPGAAAGERGAKFHRNKAELARAGAEAAQAAAIAGADIAAGSRLHDEAGPRNLFQPEIYALLAGYTNGATGAFVASGSFSTVRVRVNEGISYWVKFVTQNSGAAGVCYRNAGMARVGGANNVVGNTFVPPAGAVFMDVTFDGSSTQQRAKLQEVFRGLTATPADPAGGRVLDDQRGAIRSAKTIAGNRRALRDFFNREEAQAGVLVTSTTAGVLTTSFNAAYATSNLIPLTAGEVRVPSFDATGNLNVAFYDRDKNYLYSSGGAGTLVATNGSNQVTISTFTASNLALLRMVPGQPITVTGYFPAGTIVVDGPPGGGAGPYTLSNAATAGDGVTPVAFSAQGCTKDVAWSKPRDAEYMSFPMTANTLYWAQITNKVRAPGDVFVGPRNELFGDTPLAGQVVIFGGDSIMQSSAAGTGQPSGIIPGTGMGGGVMQYMLQVWTQADVQQARGSSGIKTRELLNALAGYSALAQTDVQALTVTATTTADSATLVVTAGTLYVGRRIEGRNIRSGTVITADLGGGSYTMSQTASGSTAGVTITAMPVRYFIEESGTNSWGLVSTAGADAAAQVALGVLGDTWTPSQFSITTTAGQTAITINSTSLGAAANGMPVVDDAANLGVGNTLVDLGGGAWRLANPAANGATFTARGGTFAGDLHDVFVTKLMTWEPTLTPVLLGLIRRFDGTADVTFSGGANYREGNPRNNQQVYLSQFNDMKRAFAQRWGLPFFDAFNEVPLSSKSRSTFFSDLLHPNSRGVVERAGTAHAKFLNSLPRPSRFS